MNLNAIYHRTSEQYCYCLNDEDLIINIKTGYDIDKIYLYHGDPYSAGIMGGKEHWDGTREEIYFKKRLKDHIWWTTTLKPQYKRCKYYFEIHSSNEVMYYFEDGFYTKEEMEQEGKVLSYFIMPWMNSADIFRTPSWVNKTIWYQIFPERFCNGDASINPTGVLPWKCCKTNFDDFYGGDIRGIRNKLSYLKSLGISGIYMTPIFESDTNHKYNTRNYYKVDPHFGTNDDLKALVKEAHENGIKIMLDAVFNHTGTDFPMWEDVIEKGQNSKYSDWYMINKWPIDLNHDTKDGGFYSFAFTQYMPKLNTNNPEVQSYLIDIVKYWINEFDIDGLRFDVGNEVSHSFLKKLRIVTKDIKSDFYLLGELWHDATNWLYGDEYDAVMNYPLATAIADFWIYKNRSRESFEYDINRCFTMYYQQANDVLLNLLDSHDTNRLLNKVGNDIDIFYQQLAVLFTMPGSPCIFYGTEIAMPGSYDPDCRRCMPWDEIDSGLHDSKINQVKELISVRKNNPACNSRNFHFPNEIPYSRVLEYIKLDEKQNIKVILNCEEKDIMLSNIDDSKILYSRKWNSGTLNSKGILITTID